MCQTMQISGRLVWMLFDGSGTAKALEPEGVEEAKYPLLRSGARGHGAPVSVVIIINTIHIHTAKTHNDDRRWADGRREKTYT